MGPLLKSQLSEDLMSQVQQPAPVAGQAPAAAGPSVPASLAAVSGGGQTDIVALVSTVATVATTAITAITAITGIAANKR